MNIFYRNMRLCKIFSYLSIYYRYTILTLVQNQILKYKKPDITVSIIVDKTSLKAYFSECNK